ncbi:MAG: DegV family protein [Desulfobacterales bacterium]|nr:DegV family protein [Desulfobacterales bacterium]
MKRLIVTDSTSDLRGEVVDQHGILILPVNVILDGKSYKDGVEITIEEFYSQYDEYETKFTEPIRYEDYALEYLQLIQKYDEIIFIHCSSHLSDTYNVAVKVHEDFQKKDMCRVEVIDSGLCSMSLGMAVIEMAKASAADRTMGEVIQTFYATKEKMNSFMAVPTLKYLKKGKKIGGAKALFGLALGVKPILEFDADGKLAVKTKLFGKQKNMILTMMDRIKEDIGYNPITLAIQHTRNIELSNSLYDVFESTFDCRKIYTSYFGPSIGINAGPETLAVMYIKHEK